MANQAPQRDNSQQGDDLTAQGGPRRENDTNRNVAGNAYSDDVADTTNTVGDTSNPAGSRTGMRKDEKEANENIEKRG